MLSRLREHVGSAGLVVAIVALVAALGGGAYAATGGQSAGKATASAKAKQGKQGKPGKTGPQGPAGPAGPTGPAGPAGAKGDAGAAGSNGTPGAAGTNGVSVTSEEFTGTKEGKCAGQGGSKFVAAGGSTFACNGKEGSPWTAGGFLPSGKTETGTWGVTGTTPTVSTPVSFTLPLEEAPELVFVWLMNETNEKFFNEPGAEELKEVLEEGEEHGCPGFENGVPLADPGKLCVYGSLTAGMKPGGTGVAPTKPRFEPKPQVFLNGGSLPLPEGSGAGPGAGPVGSTLEMVCTGSCHGLGVWAVTAE
jgi:Collagen triple helix repeat (20 copies)